jgi:hypothetical protein
VGGELLVREADGRRELLRVGCVLLQRAEGDASELLRRVGGEEVRAAVDCVDGLPRSDLAGITARQLGVRAAHLTGDRL